MIIHMNKGKAKKVIKLIVEQVKKEKVKGVKIVT